MDQLQVVPIYDCIVVEENLNCFISLCKMSISCSIEGLYCTFSAPITCSYHTLQYIPVSSKSCFSHVFLYPFF